MKGIKLHDLSMKILEWVDEAPIILLQQGSSVAPD
jgi:hypothetical protein